MPIYIHPQAIAIAINLFQVSLIQQSVNRFVSPISWWFVYEWTIDLKLDNFFER